MSMYPTRSAPGELPRDSPDLAFLMSFVTAVGGVSSYKMLNSVPGLVAGVGVSALFAFGGLQTMGAHIPGENHASPERLASHETGHQLCLIGSLLFTGAMMFRAGSNPYAGPGGAMLAGLGSVSALYHLDKMLEWRRWEEVRILEAEKLLRHYNSIAVAGQEDPQPGGTGGAPRGHGKM